MESTVKNVKVNGMENFFGEAFEKKIIKDAGHFIHLEKPEEFNETVLKFIQQA